ncbi:TniB family NTP-binding protein [Luteibacter yeojuensis]|uniref:AAA+ ATPase domain-containing protein n=1 Tax=Luteibacter yeojuensis TaxID=345309 RepID=A0A0F3KJ62_9GAMM|nr:TniB family NTP-binding protein [Luteibacter yeojuensis]KJV31300.1 hypothetical protein VI08_13680 [Luteibacter yeojuensis]
MAKPAIIQLPEFAHLDPDVVPLLALPTAERVRSMSRDFFIKYPSVMQAFEHVDFMLKSEPSERADGLLIWGDSGQGKSSIAWAMIRRYAARQATETKAAKMAPLYIDLTSVKDANEIFIRLLEQIGHPIRGRLLAEKRRSAFIEAIKASDIDLIIIDELQDLLAATETQKTNCLHAIRYIMNHSKRTVVLMGNGLAQSTLNADPHLAARYDTLHLPAWKAGPELARLLDAIMRMYPLRRRSQVTSMAAMKCLVGITRGNLREMRRRLSRAAMLAVEDETESVSMATLERSINEFPRSLVGEDVHGANR